MREATKGVVIAQVTDNQDPQNEGRVQVSFPWLGDVEPRWFSVASPMAGAGRGFFFMPEIGDEALVAFDHGDFDHGYIVGFLWNPQHRPPTTNPQHRELRSPAGHSIQMIDGAPNGGNSGAMIITDAHGNAITMTNGVVGIYSRGHLDITATSITINGRVVNPLGGPI